MHHFEPLDISPVRDRFVFVSVEGCPDQCLNAPHHSRAIATTELAIGNSCPFIHSLTYLMSLSIRIAINTVLYRNIDPYTNILSIWFLEKP